MYIHVSAPDLELYCVYVCVCLLHFVTDLIPRADGPSSHMHHIQTGINLTDNNSGVPQDTSANALERATSNSTSFQSELGNNDRLPSNGSASHRLPLIPVELAKARTVINACLITAVLVLMVCSMVVFLRSQRSAAVDLPSRILLEAADDEDLEIDSDDPGESRYRELTFKTAKGSVPALSQSWQF